MTTDLRALVEKRDDARKAYDARHGTLAWQAVCKTQGKLKDAAVNALPGLLDKIDELQAALDAQAVDAKPEQLRIYAGP